MKNWEYVVTIKISGVGIEAETTQEAIANAIRLAKEMGKEGELPKWIKNINKIKNL